jgi:zinc protease
MAARVEASSSVSSMNVAFRCLAEDLPAVFPLFSEVVQEPLMPEDKLELVRSQLLGAIARRGDDAGSIVGREFPKLLYGNESVYARVSEAETVKNVQRSDLLAFHKQVFQYVSALN